MRKIRICKETGCDNAATTEGYCRLHYLKRWKQVKDAEREMATKRLNRYVEKICRENPEDFMEVIRRDLKKPDFEDSVVEALDFSEDAKEAFGEEIEEEEIERIIKKLKVEEGF